MRKASATLKREIAAIIAESGRPRLRRAYGATFNAAVGDVLANKPMSIERENWMREKLGMNLLAKRRRRRYYRPCLDPELGRELRDFTKDEIEGILWRAVIEAKQPGPDDQDEPEWR